MLARSERNGLARASDAFHRLGVAVGHLGRGEKCVNAIVARCKYMSVSPGFLQWGELNALRLFKGWELGHNPDGVIGLDRGLARSWGKCKGQLGTVLPEHDFGGRVRSEKDSSG